MKTKLIPFDLEKAKNGAKLVYNGYPARIVCFDRKSDSGGNYVMLYKALSCENMICCTLDSLNHKCQIEEEVKTVRADDLTDLKVGDKVWSLMFGWGVVRTINKDCTGVYPIGVDFGFVAYELGYTHDGRYTINDKYQTLFRTEVKFEIPEVEL